MHFSHTCYELLDNAAIHNSPPLRYTSSMTGQSRLAEAGALRDRAVCYAGAFAPSITGDMPLKVTGEAERIIERIPIDPAMTVDGFRELAQKTIEEYHDWGWGENWPDEIHYSAVEDVRSSVKRLAGKV